MKIDTLRAFFTYIIVILILGGGFYALVLYPYELTELVKGAFIGFMGSALTFTFGQEVAKQSAKQTTASLMTTLPSATVSPSPTNGEPTP